MIAIHFSLLAVADRSGLAPPKLGWPASWPWSTGGRPDTNDRLQFEQRRFGHINRSRLSER